MEMRSGLPRCADSRGPRWEVGHVGSAPGPQRAKIDLRQATQPHQAPRGADTAGERGDRGDQVVIDRFHLIEFQEHAVGMVFQERLPDPVRQSRLRPSGPTEIAIEPHEQPVWPPLDSQLPAAGLRSDPLWIGNGSW
jgi:hypothetical protein